MLSSVATTSCASFSYTASSLINSRTSPASCFSVFLYLIFGVLTFNHFIDLLADSRIPLKGTVASSVASAERLQSHNIKVLELNQTGPVDLYVDGADESNEKLHLIKGGGGALTREKIVAAACDKPAKGYQPFIQ